MSPEAFQDTETCRKESKNLRKKCGRFDKKGHSWPYPKVTSRNKCHASSNRCLTSSNKKLVVTSATLVVTKLMLSTKKL